MFECITNIYKNVNSRFPYYVPYIRYVLRIKQLSCENRRIVAIKHRNKRSNFLILQVCCDFRNLNFVSQKFRNKVSDLRDTIFFTFLSLCILLNQFLVLLQTIKLWLKFCCFKKFMNYRQFHTHIFFLSSIRLAEFFFILLRQTNLNPSVFRIQCPRWSVIWLVNQLEVVRNIKNFMFARNRPSVKKLWNFEKILDFGYFG